MEPNYVQNLTAMSELGSLPQLLTVGISEMQLFKAVGVH